MSIDASLKEFNYLWSGHGDNKPDKAVSGDIYWDVDTNDVSEKRGNDWYLYNENMKYDFFMLRQLSTTN